MENEIFVLIVFLNIFFVPASNFGKCPVGDVESNGYTYVPLEESKRNFRMSLVA